MQRDRGGRWPSPSSEEAWSRPLPHSPSNELKLFIPWFWSSSFQNHETINFYCLCHLRLLWWPYQSNITPVTIYFFFMWWRYLLGTYLQIRLALSQLYPWTYDSRVAYYGNLSYCFYNRDWHITQMRIKSKIFVVTLWERIHNVLL